MSGSAGGTITRSLITEIRFILAGFREAEQAFKSLQGKAQQVGDIRFRVSGLQQAQAAVAQLRASARSAVTVPIGRAAIAAPIPAAGLPPTGTVRIGGIAEARAGLDGLRTMAQSVVTAVAGIAASFSVGKLVEAGDAMTRSMDRIRASLEVVGGSATEVYERIYGISRSTGIAMEAGVNTFVQIQSAVSEFGGTSQQVLQVVEGMQQAGAIAGTKATDLAEAMRQLGQGLSSTKLQGDELRSILERAPQLGRALAAELKVPVGQLRKMGADGKLTTEVVWPALVRASAKFREQFERLTVTFDRAKGIANVTLTRFLADLDQGLGLSQALAQGLLKFSNWLDGLRSRLPVVRAFVRDLGGITSVLETVAIAAGLATAAFFRFGLSLIVPGAVVLGIAAVAAGLQDLWYWVRGRPSLLGDFFGDFEPVRARIAAAAEFASAKFRELRAEVLQGLGFETTGEVIADVERRFVAFAETTRREWAAVRDAFASDGATGLMGDTFRGLAASAEAMWAVVAPIIRGLVGGPAEMAREWANVRAAIGDPLKAVAGFFDDIATRAGNVYARLTELANKMREFLGSIGLMNLTPGNGLPPDAVARARERDARGTEPFGPPAPAPPGAGPRAAPRPAIRDENGQPMYSPSSYLQDLPGRMGRAQTIAASQANSIVQHVTITATGNSAAEVASAAQSGVNRANRDAFGASETFARGLGLDMSRTELAAV